MPGMNFGGMSDVTFRMWSHPHHRQDRTPPSALRSSVQGGPLRHAAHAPAI